MMIENARWFPFNDEPIIQTQWYVPRLSCPFTIFPEDAPDGKWHIFFHSWIGIHHFISDSGLSWEPVKVVVFRGHCPSVFSENGKYYLVYEIHDSKSFSETVKHFGCMRTESRIEVRCSEDLTTWSKPKVILEANQVRYASDYAKKPYLWNPQILRVDGAYRLYFGASYIVLPDSRYKVARYFGFAEASDLQDTFDVPENSMLMETDKADKYADLALGSIGVFTKDGVFFAVRCGYFWDASEKKTSSGVILLKSDDGLRFSPCADEPVILPQTDSWASGYIKTCNIGYKEDEKSLYCYFSASNGEKRPKEKESIGLFIGEDGSSLPREHLPLI